MADIKGTYSSKAGEYPRFTYTIGYTQTARNATSVSYRFDVSYTKTNYQYGYDIQVNWNIGGVTGSKQILAANNDWVTSGSTSFTVSISTNAAGGTLPARIYTSSNTDSTHSLQKIDTGTSTTVTKSTFNTAPVLSGSLTAPTTQTIAENVKTITVTCPTATDADNNIEGYRFAVSVNGGAYSEIYKGSAKSINHTLSGGEGTTYKYSCYAYDKLGATSATIYSGIVTKNTLTTAALESTTTSSITSSTTSLTFNWGNPSNKNGNTTFSFEITSTEIPIHRATASNSTRTLSVPIVTSAPTSGPYILKNDIINKFKGTSYKGTINFTLKTTNAYGTSKTSTRSATVNLQSTPATPGSCAIASDSTAYRTINSTKYLIPDSSRTIKITWGTVTGAIGESISYDLQVKYGDGEYTQLINTTSTSYTHNIGKQTISQSVSYRVRAKASYGTTGSFKTATAATLHYYNAPTLVMGGITRGADNAKVTITVKNNTSLTSVIKSRGSWKRYATGTTTPTQQSGTLSDVQTAQIIELTGLTDAGQYDLAITYNDNTGFTSDQTETVKIGANSPLFFVNKYGVGINGLKANADISLNVKGSIGFTDANGLYSKGGIFTYAGDASGMGMAIQSGGSMVVGSGESPKAFINTLSNKTEETLNLTSDRGINFITNCQTIEDKVTATLNSAGTFNATNIQVGGNNVYHTGRKPTPADIGAAPASHTHSYLPLSGGTLTGSLTIGSGVKLLNQNNCLRVNTGQGTVDIGPQNSSYCHYTTDRPSHWFNKNVAVQGEIRCGSGYNQLVPYGSMYNGYDNGTGEVCEGRIHIGGNKYIFYGWCSISCNAGASTERTYTVPNLSRIRGITIQCYTRGGTSNFGELALKQTYSNGFTFRLYNSSNGGTHYITYMIIGE